MGSSKVLVTGGAGFIGSHLVKKLVELDYKVIVLDNFSRGSINNLEDVSHKIKIVEGDIREYKTVLKALKNVDVVFHLAALTDVQESMEKPRLYHEVNSTGTLNLLQASVRNNVKKFIYASSCAVYGEPVRIPIDEEHPLNPLSPYAASKLSAEAYCKAYSNNYGLKVLILRLFNVYGPKQTRNYAGVISEFIKRIGNSEPPIIFGDGKQARDFIYVEDTVEYLIKTLNYKPENKFEVFNIGTGKSITLNRLAKLILKIMGKNSFTPVYQPPKQGDIRYSQADISKAIKILGYTPKIGLEEGLRKTINAI